MSNKKTHHFNYLSQPPQPVPVSVHGYTDKHIQVSCSRGHKCRRPQRQRGANQGIDRKTDRETQKDGQKYWQKYGKRDSRRSGRETKGEQYVGTHTDRHSKAYETHRREDQSD